MSTPHISIINVVKRYQGATILKGISLSIRAGEFIALVGPSGCGKSTLLRAIAGLEPVDDGLISIAGDDVTTKAAADRDVAMVFQSYALYPHLSARDNMAIPLIMRRLSRWQRLPVIGRFLAGTRAILASIRHDVDAVAETLKITPLLGRKPAAMSGGQRQRVALGRAIVRQPACFLMDEPLSNLDAALRVHTRNEIVDLHKRLGVTTIYVTHDQEEALSMADRVVVMKDGRLLQAASPVEIYNNPASIEVAEFIGSPKINLISGSIDDDGALYIGKGILATGYQTAAGERVTIGIRPEHAVFSPIASAENGLVVQLERIEFLGREAIAHCRYGADRAPFLVRLTTDQAERLHVGVKTVIASPDHILVFGPNHQRILPDSAQLPHRQAHV